MKKSTPETRRKQTMYRRAHYLANRDTYLAHELRTRRAKQALNPTNDCNWCGDPYPRTQYGPRRFCSAECRKYSQRDTYLRKTYGISFETYVEMFDRQEGRCALCRRKSRFTLAVEHSHITGTVRGLCCMTCNRDILGPLDGNLDTLQAAIKFLQFVHDDLETFQQHSMPEPGLPQTQPVAPARRPVVRVPGTRAMTNGRKNTETRSRSATNRPLIRLDSGPDIMPDLLPNRSPQSFIALYPRSDS